MCGNVFPLTMQWHETLGKGSLNPLKRLLLKE